MSTTMRPAREFNTRCKAFGDNPGCGAEIIMEPTGEFKENGKPRYNAWNPGKKVLHYETCSTRKNRGGGGGRGSQGNRGIYDPIDSPPQQQQQKFVQAPTGTPNLASVLEPQVATLALKVDQIQVQMDSILVKLKELEERKTTTDNKKFKDADEMYGSIPTSVPKHDAGKDVAEEYGY